MNKYYFRKKNNYLVIIAIGFQLMFCHDFVFAQAQKKAVISEKKVTVDVRYKGFIDLMRALVWQTNIPIGIEVDHDLDENTNRAFGLQTDKHFKYENVSVAYLLGQACNIFPEYFWVVQDGVINVLSKSSKHSMMRLKIKSVNLKNITSYDASDEICKIYEFSNYLNNGKMSCFDGGLTVGAPENLSKFSIDIKGASLQLVLNKIAVHTKFWYLIKNKNSIVINFS